MVSGSQLKAGGWCSGLNTTANHQQTQVPIEDAPAQRRESQRHLAQSVSDQRKVLKIWAVGGHSEECPPCWPARDMDNGSSIVSSPILSHTVNGSGPEA